MIEYISPHNLRSRIFRFLPGVAVEARLSKYSNRLTGYRFHPIELKLDRMILGTRTHNLSEPDFFPRGRCGGAPLEIFKSIHTACRFYMLTVRGLTNLSGFQKS